MLPTIHRETKTAFSPLVICFIIYRCKFRLFSNNVISWNGLPGDSTRSFQSGCLFSWKVSQLLSTFIDMLMTLPAGIRLIQGIGWAEIWRKILSQVKRVNSNWLCIQWQQCSCNTIFEHSHGKTEWMSTNPWARISEPRFEILQRMRFLSLIRMACETKTWICRKATQTLIEASHPDERKSCFIASLVCLNVNANLSIT